MPIQIHSWNKIKVSNEGQVYPQVSFALQNTEAQVALVQTAQCLIYHENATTLSSKPRVLQQSARSSVLSSLRCRSFMPFLVDQLLHIPNPILPLWMALTVGLCRSLVPMYSSLL